MTVQSSAKIQAKPLGLILKHRAKVLLFNSEKTQRSHFQWLS